MRRRDFIGAIYCAAIALPLGAAAQQPGKVWRIGHILPAGNKEYPEALEQRLADLGYVQGRNIALLNRFPGTQPDKIEEAIVSLLPQIDLLVIWGSIAGMAAKKLASRCRWCSYRSGSPSRSGSYKASRTQAGT